ncbi:type VI secretion system receptor/chaperone Hcp [soil metagenome]
MSLDMFMKITNIDGESIDHKHAKSIDVLAWGWGMSNSGDAHRGKGNGAGKVSVQDLNFTKYIDKASTTLLKGCAVGDHYDEALLTVRKAGATPLEYLTIKMKTVLITSITTGGSGGEDRLIENVSLNFASYSVMYQAQDVKGAKDGGEVFAKFDIAANKPL